MTWFVLVVVRPFHAFMHSIKIRIRAVLEDKLDSKLWFVHVPFNCAEKCQPCSNSHLISGTWDRKEIQMKFLHSNPNRGCI